MSWHDTWKRWNQTTYGIIHSICITTDLKMGNLHTIGDNIERAMGWFPSNLGFASSVADKHYKEDSIRLDGRQANDVIAWLQRATAETLFVDLVALTDELLTEIMEYKGLLPATARYFIEKVDAAVVRPRQGWAKTAMYEMNAIRNCIIHSNSTWNQKNAEAIERLHGTKPPEGSSIDVNFKVLFDYKRAAKVFMGEVLR